MAKIVVQLFIPVAIERSQATLSQNGKDPPQAFLMNWADISSTVKTDLGRTGLIQHAIDTATVLTIKEPPLRLAHIEREELNAPS